MGALALTSPDETRRTYEAVRGVLDLLVDAASLLAGVLKRRLKQARVLLLLGGGKDKGGVGRRVLRLVLSDRLEVSLERRNKQ